MPISLLSPQRLLIPLLSTTSLLLAACSGNYDHAPSNDLTEAPVPKVANYSHRLLWNPHWCASLRPATNTALALMSVMIPMASA